MTDHTDRLASQILRAALSRFEADRQDALTTLDLYLHNSVAIGDHPNIVEEVVTATLALATAEEAITSLQRNFLPDQPLEVENDE
tara:strand:+ start:30 stop:284 length:255 start_codon:yes stop_codon:yes gene_type:complete